MSTNEVTTTNISLEESSPPKTIPSTQMIVNGIPDFLQGGREMAKAILAKDWSQTPLGSIEGWPQSLRTTVSLCLASNFPISIAWGPARVQIYNDGYWPICAAKHPHLVGQDFKECWLLAWPVIGQAFERAQAGETSYFENQRIFIDRNGFIEETFFTFSFSPIREEGGQVGGLFHPVSETTPKMLAERRSRALRDLAAHGAKAKTVEEACAAIMQVLSGSDFDLPFALLYLLDRQDQYRLVGSSGLTADAAGRWPLPGRLSGTEPLVEAIDDHFAGLPCGPYPEPPRKAVVLSLPGLGSSRAAGVVVAGVSVRLPLDEAYRDFFDLLASHIGAVLAGARAYEEERRRAEDLAELDRAKTLFFSNVSHEFRTPLTLMLGPLENLLAQGGNEGESWKNELRMVHRNGLRMLKLVNTLLDFSRIEAGRARAVFQPTDLGQLTADLASAFRSAVERAGLEFVWTARLSKSRSL